MNAMHIDPSGARWRRSSHSDNGGTCVEVTADFPGLVPVRDSKDPAGPVLVFPADTWSAFIAGVQAGEFGTV
ncbi:protein of unknown function [Streptomyces sp. TLI_053]|uniref:DUF397 domain-containing protein n=1 Tax=Streptomyces sp. TLI_053 TaxID=1855352 RepID=UPI00087BD465|nr:DUF397 domain-containing protein [Streptomyces sp. TLI_053]SDT81677.1 protein of unknown function [Streptomyces sp. TLI_053]